MLNKLLSLIREYSMVSPGQHIICACSGGADSVALLFGMYLLTDKLGIRLSAAHFNHHLRGAESDRDEAFVREFCDRYGIPLFVGEGMVIPGKKGLEAAAREARYTYFQTLDGTIATAHTADDNAETVLLHLVRGTGLKGLGGITPKGEKLIRPLLTATRQEVLEFLEEYHLPFVQDGSNDSDDFLRNRLRHHVMPLLRQENPCFSENTTAMALDLRKDEQVLSALSEAEDMDIVTLKAMPQSVRSRALERFLKENGVREPERRHIAMVENLVFSPNPSARADLPGGVTVCRKYDRLDILHDSEPLMPQLILCPGVTRLPELGLQIICAPAKEIVNTDRIFTVSVHGAIMVRPRLSGDVISLPGGTKPLKKLFIDRKIPSADRDRIPVLADDSGILGIFGIGADHKRKATELPAWQFCITDIE